MPDVSTTLHPQLRNLIIGGSERLGAVLRDVERVASTGSTVLIYGETGTGKELVAQAIHGLGERSRKSFIKLNCAAIPYMLFESELFGHEKGAFTGASARRAGRFEQAEGGTLFLDEIGELPLELQPKLLRVLQEREFERLGGTRTLRVDVRLVAATNAHLPELVQERRFREDLYYRLSVFPIRVPSLRERRSDIPLLAEHFVRTFAERMSKPVRKIAASTLNDLLAYDWPGNVRELQNFVERGVILAAGDTLEERLSPVPRACVPGERGEALADINRAHILSVLESTQWVVAGPHGAAARLGVKRSTLNFRMKKLGIVREPARGAQGLHGSLQP
jgi:formate hydrogenlyase transcriptional activator